MVNTLLKDARTVFPHVKEVEHILQELVINPFSGAEFLSLWPQIRSFFRTSSNPERLLRQFSRISQKTFNPASFFKSMAQLEPYREILFVILENSDYLTDILVRHPEYLPWLVTKGVNLSRVELNEFQSELETTSSRSDNLQQFINRVKAFKRREMLRIGTRDLLHVSSFKDLILEISLLAEATLSVVLAYLEKQFSQKFGKPNTAFCVLALGKLGGQELNYSSDVDLMFLYGEEGEISGSNISHHEYFNRLAESYVQALTRIDQGDCVYRVDTRLRPDGDAGPLARSLTNTLRYYEIRGRHWEKQILIKARPVAGNKNLGHLFLKRVAPFVYPRTFLRSPLDEVKRMKIEIETQLQMEAADDQNVKLMSGGIRDVEFLVQALQLLNGGNRPTLRTGNTLTGLEKLQKENLLPEETIRRLEEGYVFMRRVEHFQQLASGRQAHSIPRTQIDRVRLQRYMGFLDWDTFSQTLKRHQSEIRDEFRRIFAIPEEKQRKLTWFDFLAKKPASATLQSLKKFGFKAPGNLYRQFYGLISEIDQQQIADKEAVLNQFIHDILAEARQMPDADEVLVHLLELIGTYGSTMPLIELLSSQPVLRQFLLNLCTQGRMLLRYLQSSRNMFTYLLTTPPIESLPYKRISAETFLQQHEQNESVRLFESLLAIRNDSWVQLCLHFLKEKYPLPEIWRALTELADWILGIVIEKLKREVQLPHENWAIFALGKYGAREIGFGSDLDLICLLGDNYTSDPAEAMRLLQRLQQETARISPLGQLYKLDFRLRPEGNNAPLTTFVQDYIKYFRHRAQLWEKQALVKIRFVAGDRQFADQVVKNQVCSILQQIEPGRRELDEIFSMRRRMEQEKKRLSSGINIKTDAGGMVDVEFLAQIAGFKKGFGTILKPPLDTFGGIELLKQLSIIRPDEESFMINHYLNLRKIESYLLLTLERSTPEIPDTVPAKKLLAYCLNFDSPEEWISKLKTDLQTMRRLFLDTLERLKK